MLALLKAGLWHRPVGEIGIFPLPADTWDEVLRLSVQQTVTGIVADGLGFLPEALLPEPRILARWAAETDAIEKRNAEMNKVLAGLYAGFRLQGLSPVLKKGQGIAAMYPEPLLRECGDIDFYFGESHDAAAALIARTGCRVIRMSDGSICYRCRNVNVEHHSRLLDLYSPFSQAYLKELIAREGFTEKTVGGSEEILVTVPSPMLELLMLNAHAMKHIIGRGIGLRQMCDMARAYYVLHDRIDEKEWNTVITKTGLVKWTAASETFLTRYLGLPSECTFSRRIDAAGADRIFEMVCMNGNFGHSRYPVSPGGSALKRKAGTLRAFCSNMGFSLRTVPGETFWILVNLLTGQIKKTF